MSYGRNRYCLIDSLKQGDCIPDFSYKTFDRQECALNVKDFNIQIISLGEIPSFLFL